MANVDEMLETRENEIEMVGNTLRVVNEKDFGIHYEQPGCNSFTTIQDIIDNGNWIENLGIEPKKDLRFKKAKSADKGLPAPEPLRSENRSVRTSTLESLGFFTDGFDTLLVNTDGGNG